MATVDLKPISRLLNAAGVAPETAGDADSPSSSERSTETERWSTVFSRLQEWEKSPGYEDEDGYVFPFKVAISVASEILNAIRSASLPVPTWVVMTGDGGLTIDIENGRQKIEIEIDETGKQEVRLCSDNRLVERTQMTLVDLNR